MILRSRIDSWCYPITLLISDSPPEDAHMMGKIAIPQCVLDVQHR